MAKGNNESKNNWKYSQYEQYQPSPLYQPDDEEAVQTNSIERNKRVPYIQNIQRKTARILQPKGVETISAKDIARKAIRTKKVVRAGRLLWFAGVLVPAQVIFAIISIIGIGSETIAEEVFLGLFSGAVPGEAIYLVMAVLVIIIGTLSLLYAVMVFAASRVSLLSGKGVLVLGICFCLYALPIFNIIPWVFVYATYLSWQYIKEG